MTTLVCEWSVTVVPGYIEVGFLLLILLVILRLVNEVIKKVNAP